MAIIEKQLSEHRDEMSLAWEQDDPFTAEELRAFLGREEVTTNIVEALRRTNTEGERFLDMLMGREFGFIGYRNPFQPDRQPQVSALFEGTEGSVDFEFKSAAYLAEHPQVPRRPIFNFHVHTYLWPTILRDFLGGTFLPGEDTIFSDRDLGWFYQNTRNNPALTMALGSEQDGRGQIVFVTYGSEQAYLDFDHAQTYNQSKLYLGAGQDPLDAYREAGLNVAVLNLDLTKPVFDPTEVEIASNILTRKGGVNMSSLESFSAERAVGIVAQFPRIGQVSPEVYITRHPASKDGEFIGLTAVWGGAATLAEDDESIRCVTLGIDPNHAKYPGATILRVYREFGEGTEITETVYKGDKIEGGRSPYAHRIFNSIRELGQKG